MMENIITKVWFNEIEQMHEKFGVNDWFEANKDNKELMAKYLAFRMSMIKEEYDETMDAIEAKDAEEVVDGLIDMCVFAIGTLEVLGVNGNEAWTKVFNANMTKSPGVKPGRPNPFGLPDLLKPEGWTAPTHRGNHGSLSDIL